MGTITWVSPGRLAALGVGFFSLGLALGSSWNTAQAQRVPRLDAINESIPESLRPWIPWVMDAVPDHGCTLLTSGDSLRKCDWPTQVMLDVGRTGASFVLEGWRDTPGVLSLPGNVRDLWPNDVTHARADALPVFSLNGEQPVVEVPRGSFRVQGQVRWANPPEWFPLPQAVGMVHLTVEGKRVPVVQRNDQGAVWLHLGSQGPAGSKGVATHGTIELQVARQVQDGSPFRLWTQVTARVAGTGAEVALDHGVLDGATLVEIRAQVPVRIDPSGTVHVRLEPGTHELRLLSVFAQPPPTLAVPKSAPRDPSQGKGAPLPWPTQEVWAWQADEAFRQVSIEGVATVDPTHTHSPADWKHLPTYLLRAGETMTFNTLRRGDPLEKPNQLSLTRTLWLDPDGQGITGVDSIQGTMNRDWRLELTAGILGEVSIDQIGHTITQIGKEGHSGVEVRGTHVAARAVWRGEGAARELKAVGWDQDVSDLRTTLHMSPGWQLFAASGVDSVGGAWIDQWDLWSVFFVLLISLATGRWLGAIWGVLTLVTLALCNHEPNAPLWGWVLLLALAVVAKGVPHAGLRRITVVAWTVSLAVVFLLCLQFSVEQLRYAAFPHVDHGGHMGDFKEFASATEPMSSLAIEGEETRAELLPQAQKGTQLAEFDQDQDRLNDDPLNRVFDGRAIGGKKSDVSKHSASSSYGSKYNNWYDPNATVQTGPGVPKVRWSSVDLRWSGPVSREQQMKLWLMPPWLSRSLAVLRALCVLLFCLMWFRHRPRLQPRPHPHSHAPAGGGPPKTDANAPLSAVTCVIGATLLSVGLLSAGLLSLAGTAQAQPRGVVAEPSPQILEQLRGRHTKLSACGRNCAEITRAHLQFDGSLTIEATVDVQVRTAVRLPGPARAWVPERVRVDGKDVLALARLDDGYLAVPMDRGRHALQLTGAIDPNRALTLSFLDRPHHIQVTAADWHVQGLKPNGTIEGTLRFQPRAQADAHSPNASSPNPSSPNPSNALATWFRLERNIDVGLRILMTSTLSRITVSEAPQVVRVPLMEGEQVTDAHVSVQQGNTVVSFAADTNQVRWTSTLQPQENIQLTAGKGNTVSESWSLSCSPLWHCNIGGVTPFVRVKDSYWSPQILPWPGETLTLGLRRPEAIKGTTTTIDQARLTLEPGTRVTEGHLELHLRASVGGTQTVDLPAAAQIRELTINREPRTVQRKGDKVSMTLLPGSNLVQLKWQQTEDVGALFSSPPIQLGHPVTNAHVTVHAPPHRWIIGTGGPVEGPVVFFWFSMILVVLAALLLGKLGYTPLKWFHWALLGLGLAHISPVTAAIVAGWFFLIEWRRRNPQVEMHPLLFNLRQWCVVGYTAVFVGCLLYAVHHGLLGTPDMQIEGNASSNRILHWYQLQTDAGVPQATLVSLPMWTWRLVMLAWATWLALQVVKWIPWAWHAFGTGGFFQPMKLAARWAVGSRVKKEAIVPTESPKDEDQTQPEGSPTDKGA